MTITNSAVDGNSDWCTGLGVPSGVTANSYGGHRQQRHGDGHQVPPSPATTVEGGAVHPERHAQWRLRAGIFNSGTMTVTNSTVASNYINFGGAGGGIFNAGTMALANSTIAANSQGGIFVDGSALRVINSTIALNDAGLIVAEQRRRPGQAGPIRSSPSTVPTSGSQIGEVRSPPQARTT